MTTYSQRDTRSSLNRWRAGIGLGVAIIAALSSWAGASTPIRANASAVSPPGLSLVISAGSVDHSEPSGLAPPGSDALPGFALDYMNDFNGSATPSGWNVYSGVPGGDPGGQFGPGHVSVTGGMLQLSTWPDPAYGGAWVTGGLCQCGLARTYGAYFVRSRTTGPGPTIVELLWPANNQWPPEVDFAETNGSVGAMTATTHYSAQNHMEVRKLALDMTSWHTFGVIWTPGQITYLVDGKVWGSVDKPSQVPSIPMTLDIQQQTWCLSAWACPSSPQSLQVDWVAEYRMTGPLTVTVGPFPDGSTSIGQALAGQVAQAAADVVVMGCSSVTVRGYSNPTRRPAQALAFSKARAQAVAHTLARDLSSLGAGAVSIAQRAMGSAGLIASPTSAAGRAANRRAAATTCSR